MWIARLGLPLMVLLVVGLGLLFGAWGGIGVPIVMAPMQWFRMTPDQRAQVIGRTRS